MDAVFWGEGEDSFFDYQSLSRNRHIKYPMLPLELSTKLGGANAIRIQQKQPGELRVLSADIALMSSKKNNNDAASIFINSMMPTKSGRYSNNIIYAVTHEGKRTDDLSLIIRKLFDEYSCDYLVIDAGGVGLGCADLLMKDVVDMDTGQVYPALNCMNDKTMSDRCTSPDAPKVIWSIKANAQFNSECAFLLREGFRSGRIRLLTTEYDGEAALNEIRGYASLSPSDKLKLQMAYIDTTLLINEMIKLNHDESGGRVRMYEKYGMRKDRYSSLSYNFWVATQLEAKHGRRNQNEEGNQEIFSYRAPKAFNRKEVGCGRY